MSYFWGKRGWAALKREDFAEAREFLNYGLTASRQYGTPDRQGWAHWALSEMSFQEGSHEKAETHLRECILIFQANHEPHSIVLCLVKWAKYCIAWEQYSRAAIVLGSVDRAREEDHFHEIAKEQIATEPLASAIRQAIGMSAYEDDWRSGKQMTLLQMVDFILKSP